MSESLPVSSLIRNLAADLVNLRREAAAAGASPDSDVSRSIVTRQALARRLRYEPSPIKPERLRDLQQAALLESRPRIELTETRQDA